MSRDYRAKRMAAEHGIPYVMALRLIREADARDQISWQDETRVTVEVVTPRCDAAEAIVLSHWRPVDTPSTSHPE